MCMWGNEQDSNNQWLAPPRYNVNRWLTWETQDSHDLREVLRIEQHNSNSPTTIEHNKNIAFKNEGITDKFKSSAFVAS